MQQLIDRIHGTAKTDPGRLAFQSTQGNVTYQQLLEKLTAISDELAALDVRRLGIYADNSIDWALIDIAATASDIAVIPIPLFFSRDQIQHLCEVSNLDTIFCDRVFPLLWDTQTPSEVTNGEYHRSVHNASRANASHQKDHLSIKSPSHRAAQAPPKVLALASRRYSQSLRALRKH